MRSSLREYALAHALAFVALMAATAPVFAQLDAEHSFDGKVVLFANFHAHSSVAILSSLASASSGPVVKGKDMTQSPSTGADLTFPDMSPPTNPTYTKVRSPDGAFHAARVKQRIHQGVDLILAEEENKCLAQTPALPADAFDVYAVADGTVVYARQNGEAFDKGLGFTVIIDHGNDVFSLYSHLAQDADQKLCLPADAVAQGESLSVKAGETVHAGDRIGFLGRTPHPDDAASPYFPSYDGPSGNALRTEQPIQLHFEFFQASSCAPKCKPTAISGIVPPSGRGKLNPTPFLNKVGIK
jgi:hypothetical protein